MNGPLHKGGDIQHATNHPLIFVSPANALKTSSFLNHGLVIFCFWKHIESCDRALSPGRLRCGDDLRQLCVCEASPVSMKQTAIIYLDSSTYHLLQPYYLVTIKISQTAKSGQDGEVSANCPKWLVADEALLEYELVEIRVSVLRACGPEMNAT